MLYVLVGALFMSLVGVSIVNVALPSIGAGIHATESQLQWVLSGYALTFGIVLVTAGRAGDLFGRGPLFIAGVAVFTLASIAAGFAPDALSLNIARAVQGVGSGMLNPQAVGMIQQYFRGAERARAFGIFGSAVGVSVAIGPLLGGVLIQAFGVEQGWRATFFVNVPVGIITIILAAIWIPKPQFIARDVRRGRAAGRRADLDPVGSLLLGATVLLVLLPFMEARGSAYTWFALPLGIALGVAWVAWEKRYRRRGRAPMVDLGIFRVSSFANGTLLVGLYFLGITSVWVIVALYMQNGLGRTALEAGLIGLPSSILSAFAALWGAKRVVTKGRSVVLLGLYLALAGLALSALVVWLRGQGLASEWWLLASLAFIGVAQGLVISPNQALTLAEVPLKYAGSSGGIMQTGQRMGTSMGIAMITALAFSVLAATDWATAFITSFAAIGVVVVAALAVGYRDLASRSGTVRL
ncbi:MFS transporter [Leucobacter sp. HY1910]